MKRRTRVGNAQVLSLRDRLGSQYMSRVGTMLTYFNIDLKNLVEGLDCVWEARFTLAWKLGQDEKAGEHS